MRPRPKWGWKLWIAFPLLAAAEAKEPPQAIGAPEKEALELSGRLKGVPDDQWKSIAGSRVTERYSVVSGDNLYAISKRLFGDGKYWPKIWALNNGAITNPHLIFPGGTVAFEPGTATALPGVAGLTDDGGKASAAEPGSAEAERPVVSTRSGRSTDWQRLPPQKWETYDVQLPPQIDPTGFDRRSKILFSRGALLDLRWKLSRERVPFLGQIMGSRSEGEILSLQDTVYVEPEGDLQLGETYAITEDPADVYGKITGRETYAYPILGKVKLTGVRDNTFVGQVVSGQDVFRRKTSLIKLPARVPQPAPIPGPAPIEGSLILIEPRTGDLGSQHQYAFVDRGSKDGVQPGMIFRVYEYVDPGTGDKMTSADFVPVGDVQVVRAEEEFSTGLIIRSANLLTHQARAVLLTDVGEFLRRADVREKGEEVPPQKKEELDELDKLDAGGLGKEEEKELKQLERWKGNSSESPAPPPSAGAPLPPPEAAPPAGGTTPPPEAAPPADGSAPPPETAPPPPGEATLPPPSDAPKDLPPPPSSAPGELPPPPPSEGAVGPGADVPPPPTAPVDEVPVMEAPPLPPGPGGASAESQAIDQMLQKR